MTEERLRFIRNLDSLALLSDHTTAIHVNAEGRVEIARQLPAPTDEFGIPKPEIMVPKLLGQMATENYIWTGRFDNHHLATPKADYSIVRTENEGDIGSVFRGLSCLKIDLPRQMHNFAHALFELPGRPSVDVMRQAVTEVGYAKQLQAAINDYFPDSMIEPTSHTRQLGTVAIENVLQGMTEPQVGMLPAIETLADMELEELRRVVNAALRVRCFSDKKLTHPAIRATSTFKEHITRPAKTAA